jgi:hypothetical protein
VSIYRLNSSLDNSTETSAQRHFQSKKEKLEKQLKESILAETADLNKAMEKMNGLASEIKSWKDDAFVRSLKKQVRKKINAKTPKEKLHNGRHLLKAVIYSTELSPVMAGKISSVFNMTVAANLEDAIGDWHDLSLLLKGKSSRLFTQKAKQKIQTKKKAELKRVRQQIPNLLLL